MLGDVACELVLTREGTMLLPLCNARFIAWSCTLPQIIMAGCFKDMLAQCPVFMGTLLLRILPDSQCNSAKERGLIYIR